MERGPPAGGRREGLQRAQIRVDLQPVVHYPNPNLPYALITEACSADSSNPGGYSAILIKSDEYQFNRDLIKLIGKTNSGLIY